ncbi:MAG: hypothetical protein SH807_04130 [Blastochloris sp.]|nr:hypothetical protein [Blastochloris sp.]
MKTKQLAAPLYSPHDPGKSAAGCKWAILEQKTCMSHTFDASQTSFTYPTGLAQ